MRSIGPRSWTERTRGTRRRQAPRPERRGSRSGSRIQRLFDSFFGASSLADVPEHTIEVLDHARSRDNAQHVQSSVFRRSQVRRARCRRRSRRLVPGARYAWTRSIQQEIPGPATIHGRKNPSRWWDGFFSGAGCQHRRTPVSLLRGCRDGLMGAGARSLRLARRCPERRSSTGRTPNGVPMARHPPIPAMFLLLGHSAASSELDMPLSRRGVTLILLVPGRLGGPDSGCDGPFGCLAADLSARLGGGRAPAGRADVT